MILWVFSLSLVGIFDGLELNPALLCIYYYYYLNYWCCEIPPFATLFLVCELLSKSLPALLNLHKIEISIIRYVRKFIYLHCILSDITTVITISILWDVWVSMSSSTSVNLSIRSLGMALVLHLFGWSIGAMCSVMISLIDHSDNSTALASMSAVHLHGLHHHLVLGALIGSVVKWLRILLMVDCLDSTSGLGPSHQLLLVEWAIKVFNHWTSLLQRSCVISNLLLGSWGLSLVIPITGITSTTYTGLAASTASVLPSRLTTTLSGLAMASFGLVILWAHKHGLLVDGSFIWDLLKHAVLVIGLSRYCWGLGCIGVLILHVLLVLLALSMLGEVS